MNSEHYFVAVIPQIKGSQGQSLQPIQPEDVEFYDCMGPNKSLP